MLIAELGKDYILSHNQKYLLLVDKYHVLHLYDIQYQKLVTNVHVNVTYRGGIMFSPHDQYIAVLATSELDPNNHAEQQLFLYSVADLLRGEKEPAFILYASYDLPIFSEDEQFICIKEQKYDGDHIILYSLEEDEGEILDKLGTDAFFSKDGHYLLIEDRTMDYIMAYDIGQKQFLVIDGLEIIDDNKMRGTDFVFTDDEEYLIISDKIANNRIFCCELESLTVVHSMSVGRRSDYEVSKNLLCVSYIDDYWNTKRLEFYDIPTQQMVASYEGKSLLFGASTSYPYTLITRENDDASEDIIIYDLANYQVIIQKKFENVYGDSWSHFGYFFPIKKKDNNAYFAIYQSSTMRLVLEKNNVFDYEFTTVGSDDEVVTLITTEGNFEVYNLTQLAKTL
ncbi:MAG: hypothetical protein AAF770_02230 [Bacteroidota bacterium]